MLDRTEVAIAALVLAAIGLILIAPLLGRNGAPLWADAAMTAAALAGLAAFALAALATVRAARRPPTRTGEKEQS